MFYGRMGRFQLKLIYYFTYFSTVIPSNNCVCFPVGLFLVNTTFSTGLVGVEVSSVSWIGQETEETAPTRPIENVLLTTKSLQEINTTVVWDDSGK